MKRSTTSRPFVVRLLAASAAVAVLALTLAFVAVPAHAQDVPAPPNSDYDVEQRELLVVDASGRALDAGGSLTRFSVELEGEDACPGDSANDQYRVDSYLVPIEVDPTDVDFTGFGPTPLRFRTYDDFQMPLHKLTGDAFAAEVTGQRAEPGGPGPIRDIPGFDFGVYVPTPGIEDYEGGLPPGSYRIGIACTYASRITNLWETTIEITPDPADEPVGITWTITGPQPRDLESTVSGSAGPIVYVLLAAGVVLSIVSVALYRSSKRSPAPDEVVA